MSSLTSEDLTAFLPLLAEATAEDADEPEMEVNEPREDRGGHGGGEASAAQSKDADPAPDPQSLVPVTVTEARVTLSLLGTPSIHTADGKIVKMTRGKRSWPILAYLASHPYTDHSLEELASILEPDLPQTSMVQSLRTTIGEIRKILRNATGDLDSTFISQAHYRYRLQPEAVEVDLWRMHAHLDNANRAEDDDTALAALEKAVACYRGDFASVDTTTTSGWKPNARPTVTGLPMP